MHWLAIHLVIATVTNNFIVFCSSNLNENHLIESSAFQTESDKTNSQPSRLRELLVNDLRNSIIVKSVSIN